MKDIIVGMKIIEDEKNGVKWYALMDKNKKTIDAATIGTSEENTKKRDSWYEKYGVLK